MANIGLNSVVQAVITSQSTSGGDKVKNILHYRATSEMPEDSLDTMAGFLIGTVLESMNYNMNAGFNPVELKLQVVHPTKMLERIYSDGETNWGVGTGGWRVKANIEGKSPNSRAACLIRKTFKVGRKGMGRFFFGPLHDTFLDSTGNKLVADPIGFGDLVELGDRLHDEIVISSGITLRPCVVDNPVTGVSAENDVRIQTWSQYVSNLRSRRPGRGE